MPAYSCNNCDACPLKGQTSVPYRLVAGSTIMFVGESPGYDEERGGQPFTGKAGQLLRGILNNAGIDIVGDTSFANAACCRIPKDDLTQKQIGEVLACCRESVVRAINKYQPKIVVCLGDMALRQVTKMKGISKVRGKLMRSEEFNCHVMATWHPAFILRNMSRKPELEADIRNMVEFIQNGYKAIEDDSLKQVEVDSIRPLLDLGAVESAIDFESQGKMPMPGAFPISYQVFMPPSTGLVVMLYEECPVAEAEFTFKVKRNGKEVEAGARKVPDFDRKIAELREFCARADIKKAMFNGQYELYCLNWLGISGVESYTIDGQYLAHTLDSEFNLFASLEHVRQHYTNIKIDYKGDFSESEKGDMLLQYREQHDKFIRYAGLDPIVTREASDQLKKLILKDPKSANYYVNLVHPVSTIVLPMMTKNGIDVDVKALPEVIAAVTAAKDEVREKIKKVVPRPVYDKYKDDFNLNKKGLLADALFDYTLKAKDPKTKQDVEITMNIGFGIDADGEVTKTGRPSIDKKALNRLVTRGIPTRAAELIQLYILHGEYDTLLTRYLKTLPDYVGPDGKVHPTYSLTTTSSGRSSAKGPNTQNIPKRGDNAHYVRMLYIAPPGYILIEGDYSQSELRWVAHVADVRLMIETFRNDGDLHYVTAQIVTEKADIHDVTKTERQNAKPVNFGLLYGMGANGLIAYASANYGVTFSFEEAKRIRNTFLFKAYPELPEWHADSKQKIARDGYIRSVFGRKRTLANIESDADDVRASAERIGINSEIQGPSSDCNFLAALQLVRDPEWNDEECQLILTVHDAIVLKCKEECKEKYGAMLKYHMENVDLSKFDIKLRVPLVADIAYGTSLFNMEKDE